MHGTGHDGVRRALLAGVVAASITAAPAFAADGKPSGTIEEGMVQATAKVLKVDKAKRLVTFEDQDGDPVTMKVPDTVKNFDQVDPGDRLVVRYYESVAYDVRKGDGGEPAVGGAAEVERAKPGQKPGITGAQAITVTTKITDVDKKESEVTLEGPDGALRTVKVRDAAKLDQVAVGDMVDITYSEAIAVDVEPAAAE